MIAQMLMSHKVGQCFDALFVCNTIVIWYHDVLKENNMHVEFECERWFDLWSWLGGVEKCVRCVCISFLLWNYKVMHVIIHI